MRSSIDVFVEVIVAIVNMVLIVAIVVIEAMEVRVTNGDVNVGAREAI